MSERRDRRPRRPPVNPRRDRRRPPAVDAARRAAYDTLHEVGSQDAYANLAAQQIFADARLDTQQAAFATELVYGSLRMRLLLDSVIADAAKREVDRLDPRVLDVLRLGAYQLLEMSTATNAAVATSVDLARSVAGEQPVGLVNAVMRRISEADRATWITRVAPDSSTDPDGYRSVVYSHPKWIISALRDALGADAADELDALLETNNTAPVVTLAARPGRCTVEELLEAGGRPGRWSPWAVIAPPGGPGALPAVRQSRAGVQDEGSQLIVRALTEASLEGADRRWVDLCAGPGGKTALMAALAAARDASVTGVELHAHRAALVGQAVGDATGFDGVVVGDARFGQVPAGADRILLDAPCTGLGVLRRRPELRWRRTARDVNPLTVLQAELLNSALDTARPGGLVGYATCSPHIAETTMLVESVRAKRDDLEVVDAAPLFADIPGSSRSDSPWVRLWPHRHGTDGMFFALLRRR